MNVTNEEFYEEVRELRREINEVDSYSSKIIIGLIVFDLIVFIFCLSDKINHIFN